MDKNTKQTYKDSNEENKKNEANKEYEADITSRAQKTHESESNYKSKQNKLSTHRLPHNQHDRNHSRSRSPNSIKTSTQWNSANAFINFVQDFRQNCVGMKGAKVFQLAGERWRKMSFEQKQPYVNAAMTIKNQKQLQRNEHINELETNAELTQKGNTHNRERVNKKVERSKKKSPKKTKNESNTESDTASITSGTTGSLTSEDMSDTN